MPETQETQDKLLGQEDPPEGGNGNPSQYSCLENTVYRGNWWVTIHGVAKSRTQLNIHIGTHCALCHCHDTRS